MKPVATQAVVARPVVCADDTLVLGDRFYERSQAIDRGVLQMLQSDPANPLSAFVLHGDSNPRLPKLRTL